MTSPAVLEAFLETVMNISVRRMGGAVAGIMGASGADGELIYDLKKTALAIADKYTHDPKDKKALLDLAEQIGGYIQTLQVTGTLSLQEAEDALQKLDNLIQ
jgi:hypothetical protein